MMTYYIVAKDEAEFAFAARNLFSVMKNRDDKIAVYNDSVHLDPDHAYLVFPRSESVNLDLILKSQCEVVLLHDGDTVEWYKISSDCTFAQLQPKR